MADVLARDHAKLLLASAPQALGDDMLDWLSCPLFVNRTSEWNSSRYKLLVFGQETCGWDFAMDETVSGMEAHTLRHCISVPDAVDALGKHYAAFDLAECDSSIRRSPFWRAHRYLATRLEGGDYRKLLWTNLARCDASPLNESTAGVWNNFTYSNLDKICSWQKDFAVEELNASGAKAVIFFTGPNYDYILERTFEDVRFHSVPGCGESERVCSRVSGHCLPVASFRTYHPSYLSRSGRLSLLDALVEAIVKS